MFSTSTDTMFSTDTDTDTGADTDIDTDTILYYTVLYNTTLKVYYTSSTIYYKISYYAIL